MNASTAGPPVQKWTWTHWLALVVIVFVGHVLLIFIFGAHKPVTPMPVKDVPMLTLVAESSAGWVSLKNATLYALPDRRGFSASMWMKIPPPGFVKQDWTEDPRWLAATDSLPANQLGSAFHHFMQTNHSANVRMEFNVPPVPVAPGVSAQLPFARGSTLEVEGAVARRGLLSAMKLPSWPFADAIAPSVVQVIVDTGGRVISAVLLPPENYSETPYLETPPVRNPDADQYAIGLARSARFAPLASGAGSVESSPSANLSVGLFIFNWQAVPVTTTNAHP
jgi:hypothetical protein